VAIVDLCPRRELDGELGLTEAAAARFDEAFTSRYNERRKEPIEKHY